MDKKKIKLIDFAICYLLSNSDDESITDLFEQLTGTTNQQDWANLIIEIQNELGD